MKLIRATQNQFQFQLGKREKQFLLATLKLYPRVPSAHQPLSRSGQVPESDASQKLLDEALAEQRAEHKKHLQTFLADPERFAESSTGCILKLSPAEMEWLLQILNDIRVGSWILLGSPAEKIDHLDETTAPHVWAMEMAGFFQIHLLQASEEGGEA